MKERKLKVITFNNVTKKYGKSAFALRDCSFTVEDKSLAVLGCIGAGKTVLADILCGITEPTSGEVEINGFGASSCEAASEIGYMPRVCPLSPSLTLTESLTFMAKLRGLEDGAVEGALMDADAAERFASLPVGVLSGIEKKKAALAYALLGEPEYLVLDQPLSDLDEAEEKIMLELLKELKEKYVFVYLSDTLEDAGALCDRAILLSAGKCVSDGSFEQVMDPKNENVEYKIRVRGDTDALKAALSGSESVSKYKVSVTSSGTSIIDLTFCFNGDADAELRAILEGAGQRIVEIKAVDSPAEKVLAALYARQMEKEEERRMIREQNAPKVDMTKELITLFDIDPSALGTPEGEAKEEGADGDSDGEDGSRYGGSDSTLF